MKRRICSYDLAAVPEDGYVVTDDGGEIYLCNARCLCIWSVSLATKPRLSEELKARRLVLKLPAGEELVFEMIAVFPLPVENGHPQVRKGNKSSVTLITASNP